MCYHHGGNNMKLQKIDVIPNSSKTTQEYKVGFDDGFEAEVTCYVRRNGGHTMYRDVNAVVRQGETDLGETYLCDTFKGSAPKPDQNTIPGQDLESVLAHLQVIQDNPKVQENGSYGKPLYELVEAVRRLKDRYQRDLTQYQREQPKEPGTQTFTF
jgi:hypothetical protein